MDPKARNVKQKRSYDVSRRRAQAHRNQARIVDSAERLLLRDGYAATTIAAIAADADVSVDTIYKSFGGKAGLVRAIRTRALKGEGSLPAEQRSDALHRRESDPRTIIQAWGALSAEVAPRVSPILLLIRDAAATHPEGRALLKEIDDDRLRRMTQNARRLRDAGHLREGITLTQAADILWTFSSPELYELLVPRRGWTRKRYGRFIADAMIHALL
ncbi:MAG: TetR/AcrR family transcriptional regulator [Solirubrobacteraceae bacterium]